MKNLFIFSILFSMFYIKTTYSQNYQIVGSYNFRDGNNSYKPIDPTIYGDSMQLTPGYTNHHILSSHPTYGLSMASGFNCYILSTFNMTFRSNKNKLDTNCFYFTFKNIKNKVDRIRVKYQVTEGGPYTAIYYIKNNGIIDSLFRRNFTVGTHYLNVPNNNINEIINYPNLSNLDSITLIVAHQLRTSTQLYRTLGGQVRYDSIILEKLVPQLLPVKIKKFTVQEKKNYNEINLITASEKNVKVIEVLKLKNINEFEKIGEIKPIGNSDIEQMYFFIDDHIERNDNYYKLKMIDNDGYVEYSEIIYIKNTINFNDKIKIMPNIINNGNTKIKLLDISESDLYGKEVKVVSFEGKLYSYKVDMYNNINIENLSNGLYYLKYKNQNIKFSIIK